MDKNYLVLAKNDSIFVLSRTRMKFRTSMTFFIVFISTKINDLNKMVFPHQNWVNFSVFHIKIELIRVWYALVSESVMKVLAIIRCICLCMLLFGVTLFQYNNGPSQHLLCIAFVIGPKRKTVKNQIKKNGSKIQTIANYSTYILHR